MLKRVFFFSTLFSWLQHIFLQDVCRELLDSLWRFALLLPSKPVICFFFSLPSIHEPLPFICNVRLKPRTQNSDLPALPSAYLLMVVRQRT